MTRTVPRIVGWIEHKYEKLPALANLTEPLFPDATSPVSKPSPVAVWVALPLLVHVTESPSATVTVAGENLKSSIATEPDAAARASTPSRAEAEVETGGVVSRGAVCGSPPGTSGVPVAAGAGGGGGAAVAP